jgi:DNA polymerase-3 subunit chi
MTTRLIFVETRSIEKRATLCCHVEGFYEKGLRVLVVTDSTLSAQHLDQMLWTFSQESFVPHCIVTRPGQDPPLEPVVIVSGTVFLPGFQVVVADSPLPLEFLAQFSSAVHFVLTDDPEQRQKSRLLWQAARDQGWSLQHVPYTSAGMPRNS